MTGQSICCSVPIGGNVRESVRGAWELLLFVVGVVANASSVELLSRGICPTASPSWQIDMHSAE
jgi:hypothetical protein